MFELVIFQGILFLGLKEFVLLLSSNVNVYIGQKYN